MCVCVVFLRSFVSRIFSVILRNSITTPNARVVFICDRTKHKNGFSTKSFHRKGQNQNTADAEMRSPRGRCDRRTQSHKSLPLRIVANHAHSCESPNLIVFLWSSPFYDNILHLRIFYGSEHTEQTCSGVHTFTNTLAPNISRINRTSLLRPFGGCGMYCTPRLGLSLSLSRRQPPPLCHSDSDSGDDNADACAFSRKRLLSLTFRIHIINAVYAFACVYVLVRRNVRVCVPMCLFVCVCASRECAIALHSSCGALSGPSGVKLRKLST